MGADNSAENTPNATEFIWPICLQKFWISMKKRPRWAYEVHEHPFWYTESLVYVFRYSTIISTNNQAFISTFQIFICDFDLDLGRKELGI